MTTNTADENIIVVKGITKRFNEKVAVDHVDLEIKRGEIFGLLGPNGAGKTTTVRMISSLPRAKRTSKIQDLADYVSLGEYMDKTVDSLSGGWKKRVAIIAALIHEPKIIFLDEPTAGLDIQARRGLWDLVRKLNNDGTTIILTTHYIEEAENLCDRVGIIDHGKIKAIDTPRHLCETVGNVAVECKYHDGHTDYKYFKNRDDANAYSATLTDDVDVLIRKTNLEDCFVKLTGSSVGGV